MKRLLCVLLINSLLLNTLANTLYASLSTPMNNSMPAAPRAGMSIRNPNNVITTGPVNQSAFDQNIPPALNQAAARNTAPAQRKARRFKESPNAPKTPIQKEQQVTRSKSSRKLPALSQQSPAIQELNKRVIELVKDGATFFSTHSLEETCYEITHTNRFIRGELSLFIFGQEGYFLASADQPRHVWQSISGKSEDNSLTMKKLINAIKTNNGWTTYKWRHATRIIYVEPIEKDGHQYIIGSGYYSFSQKDEIVSMVKQAVAIFEQKKATGRPATDAFSDMSYPGGIFSIGNLYLFAYDFEGTTMAHGDEPSSIGINRINIQDVNGKYFYQALIRSAKEYPKGGWVEYIYRRAPKRSYVEKVTDLHGQEYVIGGGYYPTTDRKAVMNLVDQGYELLKTTGLSAATEAIINDEDSKYRFGDLYLFIYDLQGNCLADGSNRSYVDKNFSQTKDDHGNYYIQALIKSATPSGVWLNVPHYNSVESIYVRRVNLGTGEYIIGCGIYPATKKETMILLTKSAKNFLSTVDTPTAFFEISRPGSRFTKGDLNVFVFEKNGFCLAYGNNLNAVWKNFKNAQDDNGRMFIKTIISTAMTGPAEVKYRLNNAEKEMYAESTQKDGKTYIIGSSIYLE